MNKALKEEIRLNAKGAEREARLIAQLEEANKKIAILMRHMHNIGEGYVKLSIALEAMEKDVYKVFEK